MLEINGNPNRRDLSEHHARLARDAGVTIVLNTDAHGVETLDNMAYAVATARRAWLTAADVANTRGWREFKKLLSDEGLDASGKVSSSTASASRRLGSWPRASREAVGAQPGRAHQLDRLQGAVGHDVEFRPVAVLDAEHGGLVRAPGERRRAARSRRRRSRRPGRRSRARRPTQADRPDRPEPAEGDPAPGSPAAGWSPVRARARTSRTPSAARCRPPQVEADRERHQPPGRRHDQGQAGAVVAARRDRGDRAQRRRLAGGEEDGEAEQVGVGHR